MTPSHDLFYLIKSLTQTEKRHFKLYATKLSEGKAPEYLQLFQAIDAMATYDEQKLKQKFKTKTFVKQLHVVKNYLTGAILKSLVSYHDESSAHNTLAHLLQTIEILYDKDLHPLCLKQIEKGIKLCKKYGMHTFLFQFLEWQTRILMRRQEYTRVLATIQQQMDLVSNLHKYLHAKQKAIKVHNTLITKGFPRTTEEVAALKAETVDFIDNTTAPGNNIQEEYYRLFSLSSYYAGSGEHKKRTATMEKLFTMLNSNMNYSLEHPQLYLSTLNNYYNALANSGRIKKAGEILEAIREYAQKLNSKRHSSKTYAMLVSYDIELEISIFTNQTAKTVKLAPEILQVIQKADGVFQKSNTLELMYNMARVFFISQKYSDALDWINRIINEQMQHVREDLNIAARILYLVIHYELGNNMLLDSIIASTKNSIKYKRRLFKTEQTILSFMHRLNHAQNEEGKRTLLSKLATTVTTALKDPKESNPAILSDLLAWIESKLTAKSMGAILAENYLAEFGKQ